METPSSNRRITRSQAAAAAGAAVASAPGVYEKKSAMSTKGGGTSERSALLDITNDSPIVGLTATAAGCQKTPASSAVKIIGFRAKRTPGSGEALLRDQVKTLLQKVEEEGEDEGVTVSKRRPLLSFPAIFAGLASSPAQLLAPTPANTPQIPNSSISFEEQGELQHVTAEVEPNIKVVEAVVGREEAIDPQECLINRALLFDSPGKSVASSYDDNSSQSCQGREKSSASSSSLWSIQVNVSSNSDDEQVEEEDEVELLDDLFEGLRKMSVVDDELRLPKYTGKHTRFVYNEDDDNEMMMIQREEEAAKANITTKVPAGALLLKGLPAPEGKHLRFQDDEEIGRSYLEIA